VNDFSSVAKNAMNVFSDSLIVGNHDSITLFGIHPQNSMRDYSRKVVSMLLEESSDTDMAISDVIAEIQHFEMRSRSPIISFLRKIQYRKDIVKEYHKIVAYIDNMVLYFKLQQAQLTKEIKLLEKMSATISLCSTELEQCIEAGTDVLRSRPIHENINPARIQSDEDVWYDRLQRRIEDLKVSHTASLQTQAQIKLLRNNNFVMLDKIASAISNTFPIWQNQMALMLGLELLATKTNGQDSIIGTSNKPRKHFSAYKDSGATVDLEQILALNQSLGNVLTEMVQLEQNDLSLRKEFMQHII
jgi:uncharacterized protein YaaN involved in tellurite resistance